jgi:hypothetical protein
MIWLHFLASLNILPPRDNKWDLEPSQGSEHLVAYCTCSLSCHFRVTLSELCHLSSFWCPEVLCTQNRVLFFSVFWWEPLLSDFSHWVMFCFCLEQCLWSRMREIHSGNNLPLFLWCYVQGVNYKSQHSLLWCYWWSVCGPVRKNATRRWESLRFTLVVICWEILD